MRPSPSSRRTRRVLRRGDHEDLAHAGQHQRRQRVVDHRLVVDRHQLLGHGPGHRPQARARPAGQHDSWRMPHTRTGFVARVSFMSPSRDRASDPLRAMSPVTEVSIETTPIPGALLSACRSTPTTAAGSRRTGTARKMVAGRAAGLPRRCSTTSPTTKSAGVTRGIHAEPWDKLRRDHEGARLRRVGRPAGRCDLRDDVRALESTTPSRSTSPAASPTAIRRSRTAPSTRTSSTRTGAPRPSTPT